MAPVDLECSDFEFFLDEELLICLLGDVLLLFDVFLLPDALRRLAPGSSRTHAARLHAGVLPYASSSCSE